VKEKKQDAKRKTKERATPCVDPAWSQVTEEPIITQQVHVQEDPTSQQILSQLTNPMVSQLQQEVCNIYAFLLLSYILYILIFAIF
jgi:hypothetical protein